MLLNMTNELESLLTQTFLCNKEVYVAHTGEVYQQTSSLAQEHFSRVDIDWQEDSMTLVLTATTQHYDCVKVKAWIF